MTAFVVDASVAAKWFLEEDGSETALSLVGRAELLAPELVVPEVANLLWKAVRLGKLELADARRSLAALPAYFDECVGSEGLAWRAFDLAITLGHPVYDCFYLALAQTRGLPLVTADARLSSRLAGGPWAGLVQPLGGLAAG